MKMTSAYANKLLKSLADENLTGQTRKRHPALTLLPSARNQSSRSMTTPPFPIP